MSIEGFARTFDGTFIRAPQILDISPTTEVLARCEGRPVLVRQGNVWAGSFHPELGGDLRLHAACRPPPPGRAVLFPRPAPARPGKFLPFRLFTCQSRDFWI